MAYSLYLKCVAATAAKTNGSWEELGAGERKKTKKVRKALQCTGFMNAMNSNIKENRGKDFPLCIFYFKCSLEIRKQD